ncbi:hypothetical protein AHAS_Ahas12G0137100 [Arachis hypogaea]
MRIFFYMSLLSSEVRASRVYLTGGFKKPRELTWVTGVVLAVLTASFGVTGYSLPWDQIGYWAVKIVTGVPEAIPGIGSSVVELLRGSASVGQSTLTHFYSLHTFVLPLLTAVFMLMHFPMIRAENPSLSRLCYRRLWGSRNRRALILGWAYYLDAFSSYPLRTWLPSVYRGHDNWHTRGASFPVLSY